MRKITQTLMLILTLALAPCSWSATWTSNGTVSNIQSIHDNASTHDGDTITMPPTTQTWTSGVAFTKGITLQGVDSASTRIIRGVGYTGALVAISGFASDVPVRVTGIRFDQALGQAIDSQAISVQGPYGGSWGINHLRIDHCYFYGGFRTILLRYRINGVADHNVFQDCAYITEYYGDDDFAWTRVGTPTFGTSDSFFFEDNQVIMDSAMSAFDTLSDENTGGRLVWRYNNFDTTAFAGVMGSLIGEHGNQAYWAGTADWLRGGISCEFYNNTVLFPTSFRLLWFRGGRNIVANNTFTGTLGSGAFVAFDEEEAWGGSGISPTRVGPWPSEDQVNNTFIFGNTLNGGAVSPSNIYCWNAGSAPMIHLNRDYWLTAPSVSTQTTYTQPGAPSLGGYPMPYNPPVTSWTPYTYPHPLVGISSPTPTPTATATATSTPTSTPTPTATPDCFAHCRHPRPECRDWCRHHRNPFLHGLNMQMVFLSIAP